MKRISLDIQTKVDEYIELDAKMKSINAELKKLRKDIEPYMTEKNITVIPGTVRGSVSLEPRNMAVTSARLTSFDVDGVVSLLDAKARKECIVKAVDKDMLELLVKTGRAPMEVNQFRIYRPTVAFTINHK
jgi:YbbR domain-containing protein